MKSLLIMLLGWFGLTVQPIVVPVLNTNSLENTIIQATSTVTVGTPKKVIVKQTPAIKQDIIPTVQSVNDTQTSITQELKVQKPVVEQSKVAEIAPIVVQPYNPMRSISVMDYSYSCNRALLFDVQSNMVAIATWLSGLKPSKSDILLSPRPVTNQGESYLLYTASKSESRAYVSELAPSGDSEQIMKTYLNYCPPVSRSFDANTYVNVYGETIRLLQ